jgi:isopentenyl-diphosphate delta-isomerase
MNDDIYQRKRDHLDLCYGDEVAHGAHRGLLDDVQLVHDAIPELSMDDLDLSTAFLDHTIAAPLMITGMTGGPPEAGEINRALAALAQEVGIPFGVGSQRVATRYAEAQASFEVRAAAPDVVLLGNIGVMQAKAMGPERARALMESIGADYLAVHLNPAMELVQPGADADSDFRGGYDIIGRLVDATHGRVLVKECGTGLAPQVVQRLTALGVRALDLSGSGGTSWVKVEALRAEGDAAEVAHLFDDWGIPTAATAAMARAVVPEHAAITLVCSGGISNGLDAAKVIALGANVAGMARPVLQAYHAAGVDGARAFFDRTLRALRIAMALTGCTRPAQLRSAPRIVGPRLRTWIEQAEGWTER